MKTYKEIVTNLINRWNEICMLTGNTRYLELTETSIKEGPYLIITVSVRNSSTILFKDSHVSKTSTTDAEKAYESILMNISTFGLSEMLRKFETGEFEYKGQQLIINKID